GRVLVRDEGEQLAVELSPCLPKSNGGRRDAVERRAGHESDVDGHGDAGRGRTEPRAGGGGRWTTRRITPPPSSRARAASSRETGRKYMTIAVLTIPPGSARSWRASFRSISQPSMRILSLRSRSLLFVAR